MALKDYATTKDGIEMQLGSNHVGHFLLTNLLLPKLLAAGGGARIVNVSSFGYMSGGVRFDDPSFQVRNSREIEVDQETSLMNAKHGEKYNAWLAYAQSKTANILFTAALANKLKNKGVLSFALNPGRTLSPPPSGGPSPHCAHIQSKRPS